jgi:hypothetical protein
MDSIEQIIDLNNQGVNLLGHGDDQQAVSVFTTSLLALQRLIGVYQQACTPKGMEDEILEATAVPAQCALQHLEGSSYFIYNKPLAMNKISTHQSSDLQLYSACTILNLALAYHRQAKRTCNQACLQKAEAMYDMIATLLRSRMDDTALFVRMISVNNLSEIHYEQGKYDQTREELQWLSNIIHQGGSKLDFFNQGDLNLLLLNVLALLTPPQAAAAA